MANWWESDPKAATTDFYKQDPVAAGTTAQKPSSLWDHISGLYRAGEEGLTRGVMGTLAAPRTASDLANQLESLYREKLGVPQGDYQPSFLQRHWPTAEEFRQSYEQSHGGEPRYEAKNLPERIAQSTGEFAAAGVGGEGGLFARLAKILAPATTSEIARQATEGKPYQGIATGAAALLGSGAVKAGQALAPRAATDVIAGQLANITPVHIDQARSLIQNAATRGVDLTWPEALSQVTGMPVMSDTMRHLEAHPETAARMQGFFAQRPQQVEQAVGQAAQEISPGQPPLPSNIGPAVGRSAFDVMRDVEKLRTQAVDPYYQAAKTDIVPHSEVKDVVDNIDKAIANDKTGVLHGPLTEFRNLLVERPAQAAVPAQRVARQTPAGTIYTTIPGKAAVPETYITDVENLDRARKYVRDRMEQPQIGQQAITKEQGSVILDSINDLQSRMLAASPNLQRGKQLFQDISEKYINPLQERLLGQLASKDLETRDAIGKVFARDPLANSHPEVTEAIGAVVNKSPKAASDLVRNYLETAYNNTARDLQTRANQAGGAKFRAAVMGSPQQRSNMQAAVEALPNGQQRWEGLSRLFDIMEATGTRQNIGSKTAYNVEALKEMQPGVAFKTLTSTMKNPLEILKPIGEKFDQWRMGRNMNQIADILTDPSKADLLRKLAASPRGGDREFNLARALVYSTAATRPNEKK